MVAVLSSWWGLLKETNLSSCSESWFLKLLSQVWHFSFSFISMSCPISFLYISFCLQTTRYYLFYLQWKSPDHWQLFLFHQVDIVIVIVFWGTSISWYWNVLSRVCGLKKRCKGALGLLLSFCLNWKKLCSSLQTAICHFVSEKLKLFW